MDIADFHGKPVDEFLAARKKNGFDAEEVVCCLGCGKKCRAGSRLCQVFSPKSGANLYRRWDRMFHHCPYCAGSWYLAKRADGMLYISLGDIKN